jgi:hypothetical protein
MPWRPTLLCDVEDPTLLESRLTDGGEFGSLTRRPRSTAQKFFFSSIWYSFPLEAEQTPRPSAAGRIR